MASKRIDSLQGIRGVAILALIIGHASVTPELAWLGDTGIGIVTRVSTLTIEAFFILSGYLITSLLIRERDRSGRIDLRSFYLRRVLRIMPAFYLFLAAMGVLALLGIAHATGWEFFAAGVYIWNYAPWAESHWLGHTWSLSVEEQFYLLWPLGLLLLGKRRALAVAIAGVVLAPVIRVATYAVYPDGRDTIWQMFHARADGILLGCAIALTVSLAPELYERISSRLYRLRIHWFVLPVAVGSALLNLQFGGWWQLVAGYSLEILVLGAALTAALRVDTPFARVLAWRPFVAVGAISYSLYLWQQPFLLPQDDTGPLAPLWIALPAVFAIGTASYFLVERPFMRLKDRSAQPRSGSVSVTPPPTSADPAPADPVPADPVPADAVPDAAPVEAGEAQPTGSTG